MTIQIPEPVQWLVPVVVGTDWPEGDEDALRRLAQAWGQAATAICQATGEGNVAARTITQVLGPIGGIEEAFNPEPAEGGADGETPESLVTRALELSISGAGRADVNATEVLKVTISGAGKVTYSGNPSISKEISGAGSVKKRD